MMSILNDFLPLRALPVGLACMFFQLFFMLLFAYVLPAGPWTKSAGVTAHQVVCMPLMVFLTIEGYHIWLSEQNELYEQGIEGRIFVPSKQGVEMASMLWGMMMLWDIPCSFLVKELGDPVMLVHHVGLAFVAGTNIGIFSSGIRVGSYYAAFFFGVIETSSIVLALVDMFHPRNKEWFKWLNESKTSIAAFCRTMNEINRPLFAIAFLIFRCVWFPYVMFTTCLPDLWIAGMLPTEERRGVPAWLLLTNCLLSLVFTLMQLYWGKLVGTAILKAVGIIETKPSEKDD